MTHIHMQHTLCSFSCYNSLRRGCIDQAAISLIKPDTREKRGENRRGEQTKDRRTERKTYDKTPTDI